MDHEGRRTRLYFGDQPRHHEDHPTVLSVQDVSFWYGEKQALRNVSLDIHANEITAFIGPSGCGKSTLLRCLNRMNEEVRDTRMTGRILVHDTDLHDPALDLPMVRRRFGWIAQKPNPFPRSIRWNILYGPRIQGLISGRRDEAEELLERTLRAAGLWDEVRDRLDTPGDRLSIGQQQRLCIARAIATEPEFLLMDEPCSALDPISTAMVEELMEQLRASTTLILITHNLQQAARVSQRTAFFHLGRLDEVGDTESLFLHPQSDRCHAFISGLYG